MIDEVSLMDTETFVKLENEIRKANLEEGDLEKFYSNNN